MRKGKIYIYIMIAIMMTSLAGCGGRGLSGSPGPVSREEFLIDTICSISVYRMESDDGSVTYASKQEARTNEVIDEAFDLCKDLESMLSRTRADSDISRINEAGGSRTEVSRETMELIDKGLEYSELSGGDFDITVGGITEQWDFHAAEGKAVLPDEKALEDALPHIGYKNVETDGSNVRLKDPGAKLDLGGIAKGYIGDKMSGLLKERGVASAIINLGGNVICIGGKTDDDDFVIGVEAPFSDRTEIIGKVKVRDRTVVTSGVYERKFEKDGRIYHHILDSRTGWPADTDLDAVTIVADEGRSADADALSTICLIKGSDAGLRLIEESEGVEGIFVLSDGSIRETSGMEFEKE